MKEKYSTNESVMLATENLVGTVLDSLIPDLRDGRAFFIVDYAMKSYIFSSLMLEEEILVCR
jgi:hypothetical protein